MADCCAYWFPKAHDALDDGDPAGLVCTQYIRNTNSPRGGLDYIVENGGVFGIAERSATIRLFLHPPFPRLRLISQAAFVCRRRQSPVNLPPHMKRTLRRRPVCGLRVPRSALAVCRLKGTNILLLSAFRQGGGGDKRESVNGRAIPHSAFSQGSCIRRSSLTVRLLSGVIFAFAFLAFMPCASAVILMVVLEDLTLFEIEGVTFTGYSTSAHGTLRFENTDTGEAGLIDLQGQSDARSDLALCALSREDPQQKVKLEIDVAPLFGPATRSFFQLDTLGTAVEPPPITDPALAALIGPLEFGFRLESESIDPISGNRQTQYRLESVQQTPEPGSFCLLIAGALPLINLRRRAPS